MEIFDVFSMNGIENNPASGEIFLENVILKVSQTHFPRISIPRGANAPPPPLGLAKGGGHKFFKGGGAMPPLGGAVKYPGLTVKTLIIIIKLNNKLHFIQFLQC